MEATDPKNILERIYGKKTIEKWSLVLLALRIPHVCEAAGQGYRLVVQEKYRSYALRQIEAYRKEQLGRRRGFRVREQPATRWVLPVAALSLAGFFMLTNTSAFMLDWIGHGRSAVTAVQDGEWWRTVTALTLHGDWGHLFSNLVCGWIFIGALTTLVGEGVALLLAIASGASANFINALVYASGYASIGASGAVFGALGALIAIRFLTPGRRERFDQRLVVMGGVAVLALLGFDPSSDISGHVAGFFSGIIIGCPISYFVRRRRVLPRWLPLGFAAGLPVLAWLLAFTFI